MLNLLKVISIYQNKRYEFKKKTERPVTKTVSSISPYYPVKFHEGHNFQLLSTFFVMNLSTLVFIHL